MTIAAAGFRQFEALGLAESVRSGSSGSSTNAPTGTCLTLRPATVRCLRRMLNRPVDFQVNAFSELIWCIMKLCKQHHQQSAFCQYVQAAPQDLQDLLDWASGQLEATFEGLSLSAPHCDAHALVTRWESSAPVTCAEYFSLSTAIDTAGAGHARSGSSGSSGRHSAEQAATIARAAIGVIHGFVSVWQPHPPRAPHDGPVRRKLMFTSSSLGTAASAAAPARFLGTGKWRQDLPTASPQADIAPGSRPHPRGPRPHPRAPRSCGGDDDSLDVDPSAAPAYFYLTAAADDDGERALRQPSHASLHSIHKSQGSAASVGTGAAARLRHLAEPALPDQDPDTASLAAPCSDELDDSLSVYLARRQLQGRQQEPLLRPPPTELAGLKAAAATAHAATDAPPRSPPQPVPKRPSRVMSAIRNLVLPSCMRHLATVGHQRAAMHRPRPRHHRAHQYSAAATPRSVARSTPMASAAAASDCPAGLQRSHSFERWIRQQAPITPSPSFTAARVSHSSSSDTTAARTAQWVFDAVQQAADRLALEHAPDDNNHQHPHHHPAPADALPSTTPPHTATMPDACTAASSAATAFPSAEPSAALAPDTWTPWDPQQRAAAALHTPQHPAPESFSQGVSTLANSVCSADLPSSTEPESAPLALRPVTDQPLEAIETPAAAVPHPTLDAAAAATTSLQASPPPLTSSDFPPSPMFPPAPVAALPNLPPVTVLPPEIMDPITPSASVSRAQPGSPSMRLLRRSVGSWASDTPSTAPPADASPRDPLASPFGNASPIPPAASWASTVSPHNSVASFPHQPPSPTAPPLAPIEGPAGSTATAPFSAPISPMSGSQYAGLRRDSWSSDYSGHSPAQSRPADTVFAQYQHQHQQTPHTHHQVLPVPTSTLPSLRSIPQVPSRLGSRRNHLARASSARSATATAITAAAAGLPAPTHTIIDDTGDSAAAPAAGGDGPAAAGTTQSRDLDIDTHFFSDRGTTITGSADLDALDMLHTQPSFADNETLQPAFSGISEQQLARAVTLDALLMAAQQQLSRATSAAPLPLLPALPPPSSDTLEPHLVVPSSATVPELPAASGSDLSDGRGGLSGLSVRLALAPEAQSSSSEEEEAPQTLRHFGSFTGSSEPAHLSSGRLGALGRTAPRCSVGQAV